MRFRLPKIIICSFILFFIPLLPGSWLPAPAALAEETRSIEPQQWKEITADKELNYKNEKELAAKKPAPQKQKDYSGLSKIFEFIFSNIAKFIVIVIIAGIVCYGIYLLAFTDKTRVFSRGAAKTIPQESIVTEQETFLNTDWRHLMQLARDANDPALAIRYAYMHLLQKMVLGGLVHYTPDKTNQEYIHEVKDDLLKAEFKAVTRQYEYAYYGHYPVTNTEYVEFNRRFDAITARLR